MKALLRFLILLLFMCPIFQVCAQAKVFIGGKVLGELDEPVVGATVFLSGTQRTTATDEMGTFLFIDLDPGSYTIVVKMMGYTSSFQSVVARMSVGNLVFHQKISPSTLNEVVIGGRDRKWGEKYDIFKQTFLGETKNGRNCRILNPESLQLRKNKSGDILEGSSNDFLIIENKRLGYRIKYLLKNFEYNYQVGVTTYSGETCFEEMIGNSEQETTWAANRRKTYYNSAMHFFRSVYAGKTQPEEKGFVVRSVKKPYLLEDDKPTARMRPSVKVETDLVRFDSLVTIIDTSFISFKFKRALFIEYKVKKTLTLNEAGVASRPFSNASSILQLGVDEAVIDSRGKVINDRPFLIMGLWGRRRVGDQLPFDYQP